MTVLKFDDTTAALYDDGTCLRAFGWPRDGGHVWETVGQNGDVRNVSVTYARSTNTILAEDDPAVTAAHLAEICGADAVEARGMTTFEFRQARKALGLTQEQMAAALGGMSKNHISAIERGAVITGPVEKLMRAYIAGYRPDDWPSA